MVKMRVEKMNEMIRLILKETDKMIVVTLMLPFHAVKYIALKIDIVSYISFSLKG